MATINTYFFIEKIESETSEKNITQGSFHIWANEFFPDKKTAVRKLTDDMWRMFDDNKHCNKITYRRIIDWAVIRAQKNFEGTKEETLKKYLPNGEGWYVIDTDEFIGDELLDDYTVFGTRLVISECVLLNEGDKEVLLSFRTGKKYETIKTY